MLPMIVQHSETLVAFLSLLNPALYQPQIRHVLQIVDALLASNERKMFFTSEKVPILLTKKYPL